MTLARVHVYAGAFNRSMVPRLQTRLKGTEVVAIDTEEAFADQLAEIEALLVFRAPVKHWDQATNLRLLHTSGAGVDRLLPNPDIPDQVQICNASGVHEPHMAEYVLGLLFAISKNVPQLVNQQRDHLWRTMVPRSLSGLKACVVGLGTIGESVATRLAAFGISVVGVRRSGEPSPSVDEVFTPDRLQAALRGRDIVVVVTPRTPDTIGLVGPVEVSMLNPHSYLVDVSRGGVTDIQGVVDALVGGRLAAAAMDVFEPEPLPADSALWETPGLLISPHNAGWSDTYFDRLADTFVANVEALRTGGPFVTPVDRTLGY